MTPFTVHTPESAPEASKATLAAVQAAWGFVPTLHGTLAESPTSLAAYEALFGLVGKSSLSAGEQQVAFLAISAYNACRYCVAGHTYLARAANVDEQAIEALRGGTAIATPRLQALRVFCEAVVRERGFVGEAALQAFLSAGFSKAQVLEVVTVVATKTISNYTNHITGTPLEGFMSDPALHWTAPSKHALAA